MTRRGKAALAFGLAAYLAAWLFGSKALYPVAIGLVLAVLAAWAWMLLARRPVALSRITRRRDHFEGDDVEIAVDVELGLGLLPPGPVVLGERLSKLGDREVRLGGYGARRTARYVLQNVPRGRYVFERARAALEDPFGLQRVEVELPAAAAILVYPRLVPLERLFSDSGVGLLEGRRLLLRRPSGFDLHSVREYEQGESLRRVHWRSTAKRGRLMVKELEDAPRDEVAVLLDAQAAAVAGTPPESSFDVQVRAAGSILLAHAKRNRRVALLVNGAEQQSTRISSADGDWRRALELLAAAEPNGSRSAASVLADETRSIVRALELTVVTASLTPELVDRLLQHALAHRRVSLVYVDAQTFAGRAGKREPALLRLQTAGVPLAVLRRGDDLAAVLGGPELAEAAHA